MLFEGLYMKTINKESLRLFLDYQDSDEIDVSLLNQFIVNKTRNKREDTLRLMNLNNDTLRLDFVK